MDWSSDDNRDPLNGGRDELDLAALYSEDPEFSAEFSRQRAALIERWHALRGGLVAPVFSGQEDLPEGFATQDAVVLAFDERDLTPEILFLGSQIASDAPWVRGRVAPALEFLRSMYSQAVANMLPLDFSERFELGGEQVVDCRGVALPFSSDGLNVDIVLAKFDLADDGVLETHKEDAASGTELLLEQEFDSEDARETRKREKTSPFFVISTRKSSDEPIRVKPRPQSTDVVVPQRLTLLNDQQAAPGLNEQLHTARELAAKAFAAEERSHLALYHAIGAAYDLALAKKDAPEEFAELLVQEGITVQERAEMTPVVKLVFGKDYDKTRITEYASALTHAARAGLRQGELPGLLYHNDGGLKGIVQTERALRRQELGRLPAPRHGVRPTTAKKLRKLPQVDFGEIPEAGEEFALVMIRRGEDGQIAMLGEVPDDRAMLERASRRLLAKGKERHAAANTPGEPANPDTTESSGGSEPPRVR